MGDCSIVAHDATTFESELHSGKCRRSSSGDASTEAFFVKKAGARNYGKLFTVPPFSSPDSSSETGLVAFSGWSITSHFASAMSSSSNLAMTLRKLK